MRLHRKIQRKPDVFELSRNLQIHKFINLQRNSRLMLLLFRQLRSVMICCVFITWVCLNFKDGSGYLERATVCQLVNSLFRSLGSVDLGFIPEEELEKG
jgi:hypothetical protein